MDWIADPIVWFGFLSLTALEIVLGIDNIVFISIIAGKLPQEQQAKARQVGLLLAMGTRIALLLAIQWMAGLKDDLFWLAGMGFSGRDLILLFGGLFLIAKAVNEIHAKLEGEEHHAKSNAKKATFNAVIAQILIVDVVFSLDSVITAIGMANRIGVMIAAVVVSIIFMLAFAKAISEFVDKHPTVKMLALAFLVLIGVNLVAEGFGQHIPKGYTYFAMAFSVVVEMLNLRSKKKDVEPVVLRRQEPV
jgi:predicted tellurium resistance membrane protein TerC